MLDRAGLRIAALTLLALFPSLSRANPGPEGEPHFGISAYFRNPPRLGEAVTLQVRVWGEDTYPVPWTSIAKISIPPGIDVVSGDTLSIKQVVKRTRLKPERTFDIVVRPRVEGAYVIHGSLEVEAVDERGTDLTDFILPVALHGDSVTYARAPRTTRFENVRGGQRYRYAGPYLVPIDSTAALLEEEIDQKPRVLSERPAECPACPAPLPRVVPFVAMVGSDGRVRDTRFLDIDDQGTVDPAVVGAASAALARWEFAPATAGGRPVADFLVVRVPVKSGQP